MRRKRVGQNPEQVCPGNKQRRETTFKILKSLFAPGASYANQDRKLGAMLGVNSERLKQIRAGDQPSADELQLIRGAVEVVQKQRGDEVTQNLVNALDLEVLTESGSCAEVPSVSQGRPRTVAPAKRSSSSIVALTVKARTLLPTLRRLGLLKKGSLLCWQLGPEACLLTSQGAAAKLKEEGNQASLTVTFQLG